MVRHIEKIGRQNCSILITIIALALSQGITLMTYAMTRTHITFSGRIASLVSPLLIAPLFSWWFIGILLKVRTMEQEMRCLATYDALTGVYNRNSFFPIGASILNVMRREKLPLTVLYADIDHFKKINDTFGHDAGDFVLKKVGEYFISNMRKSDIVGRVGGEEFVAVLPNTPIEDGMKIADKIRVGFEGLEMTYGDGTSIKITVSIGLSCDTDIRNIGIDELLKKADAALYNAKRNGRNRISVHPIDPVVRNLRCG